MQRILSLKNSIMKLLFGLAILGAMFLTACVQKEEKRDEFKENHSVDEKRNAGVDSAALEPSQPVVQ
ncbi:hypothetical protein FIC_01368 [Flavobacteriaceae bacterium 3519-10]|nr:hypothetical protein FIC_01368 [Flavobacteriaceae bacterium 3519-10]